MFKKGYVMTEEHKRKIGNAHRGRIIGPMSEEHKKAISDAHKRSGLVPPSWKGKKRSPESVEKSASWRRGRPKPNRRGENNHLWKGGITPINARIRTSIEYKIWRRAVFERDNYSCVWCNDRQSKGHKVILHADHIKPFAYFPELRFAIDNGRTLCISCHKKTDSYLKVIRIDVEKTVNGLA